MNLPPIAVTAGEPAGIGPDLVLQLSRFAGRIVVIADPDLLAQRARMLGLDLQCRLHDPAARPDPRLLDVIPVPLAAPVTAGRLDPANARHVLHMLDTAIDGCMDGRFAGMVTAPVHKGIINDAGIPFSGHTEYLAERTGTPRVVMMLAGAGMRVALATTHLPLRAVPDAITQDSLEAVLRILDHDLRSHFGVAAPRILVAGLNPHAGEGGHMGREEIDVLEPVIARLCAQGMRLTGPLPADTLFNPAHLVDADAVLAMFHDQGLPVLKHASFGAGVNITLGLPLIRTSVDHGTALDLAGTGRADPGSLFTALETAFTLAAHRFGHDCIQ